MGVFKTKVKEETKAVDTDLVQSFQDVQNKNDMAEVLKELFNEDKIHLMTELSRDEINYAVRIYMIAEMKNMELYKTGLFFFLKLMLSKDRKSRVEMLKAISGYNKQQGLLQKMNPFNRGGGF